MPPAADVRLLRNLSLRLEQTLHAGDWAAIADIDRAIREQLQELAAAPGLSPEVLQAKQRLKQLHARALRACAAECERLWELMQSHLDYAEGQLAYRQIELLQGGGDR